MDNERLTYRDEDGIARRLKNPTSSYIGTMYEEERILNQELLDKLAQFEDEQENNQNLKFLCKVGDTIYIPNWVYIPSIIDHKDLVEECIQERKIIAIMICESGVKYCFWSKDCKFFGIDKLCGIDASQFGTDWFIDKDQAKLYINERLRRQ